MIKHPYEVRRLPLPPPFGLAFWPTLAPKHNDEADTFMGSTPHSGPDVSGCAKMWLGKHAAAAKVIVEIGVAKDNLETSGSRVLMESKPADAIYVGVDKDDKTALANPARNIHILQADSSDHQRVYDLLDALGADAIDLLFIDGWHSVRQAVSDWRYVHRLHEGRGVVLIHDTHYHPGPVALLEAIDRTIFDVRQLCDYPSDYGLAEVTWRAVSPLEVIELRRENEALRTALKAVQQQIDHLAELDIEVL